MAKQPQQIMRVLYVDLRDGRTLLEKSTVDWHQGLTAEASIAHALGQQTANQVGNDLHSNELDLIVSYVNSETGEHSEIGGVGSLDWEVQPTSILVVVYENKSTSEEQRMLSTEWMLENEHFE